MTAPTVVVVRDADLLAELVAARLLSRLVEVQAERGSASLVLTGGGAGIAALEAVRRSPARAAVDWRRVDLWWGDERFVPAGDPDRNELQARQALLDHLDLDPAQVHPMPASDHAADPDTAAERYAAELQIAAPPGHACPPFDVLLMGMGGDGHIASIFAESAAARDEGLVVGVHAASKPPPQRVSLTFPAINAAREVWMIVAGAEKAAVVARALAGADRLQVPAAGVGGTDQTLWLLDESAAGQLPRDVRGD